MPVERMKPISLFVPFEPIERRGPGEPLIVEGYCFVNETVEGEGGVVIERAAMEEATPEYMRYGAVREMHGPFAAGTALSAEWDDRGCRLRAKIVDPVARLKCEEGVYKGFSISVAPRLRVGNRVKQVKWGENSLVDAPKDPDALFNLCRADGFDPNAEVEVEVIEDTSTPADETSTASSPDPASSPPPSQISSQGEDPAPDSSLPAPAIVSPSDAAAPSPEGVEVAQPSTPDGGTSSSTEECVLPTEEQRAAIVEALRAAGLPEELAARVTVAERAQTSTTVPIRENLEGKRKPMSYAEDEPGIERVIKKEGEKWCVYSESGRKLGEHDTREEAVKQLQAIEISKHKDEEGATQPKDRMKDEKRAMMGLPIGPPQVTEQPDGRWMLESSNGTLLGYYASREEAEAHWRQILAAMDSDAERGSGSADVERTTPSADTVSPPEPEGQDALTRLQVAHEETLTRLAAVTGERDEALTRLATAEAAIERQNVLLAQPRDVPPARFLHSLSREFMANLGGAAQAETQRLEADYKTAKEQAESEKHGDITKRDHAIERMLTLQALLAERGVRVS